MGTDIDIPICEFCKTEQNLLQHHILYHPEETITVCRVCHYKITRQIKEHAGGNLYLCINCGRHYTGDVSKVCYYCRDAPNKKDWFGLTSKDKTKPIFRYNYHWLETNWL